MIVSTVEFVQGQAVYGTLTRGVLAHGGQRRVDTVDKHALPPQR